MLERFLLWGDGIFQLACHDNRLDVGTWAGKKITARGQIRFALRQVVKEVESRSALLARHNVGGLLV
jgi:hypothetical protein